MTAYRDAWEHLVETHPPPESFPSGELTRLMTSVDADEAELRQMVSGLPPHQQARFEERKRFFMKTWGRRVARWIFADNPDVAVVGIRSGITAFLDAAYRGPEIAPLGVCDATGARCDATWEEVLEVIRDRS